MAKMQPDEMEGKTGCREGRKSEGSGSMGESGPWMNEGGQERDAEIEGRIQN